MKARHETPGIAKLAAFVGVDLTPPEMDAVEQVCHERLDMPRFGLLVGVNCVLSIVY